MKLYDYYLFCFLLLFYFPASLCLLGNPYEILGVKQTSNIQEIKRAYKRLAKNWHPDKNKDPQAETRFVEINQAYELLSDPERRQKFDRHGVTEDTPNFRQQPDYSNFNRFDPFDAFFGPGGFKFEANFNQGEIYRKYTITTKAYENNIIPKSLVQPQLIIFYTDWCFPCLQAEPIWRKIVEEFEPIGVGIASVHAELESSFSKKIGVTTLPYLILVLDAKVIHYRLHQLSLVKAVEFVKSKFPYKTVTPVMDDDVVQFLEGWEDNRVRVLFFGRQESVRLRYLLVAFRFRAVAVFGYVQQKIPETEAISKRFYTNSNMETLLVFNENVDTPVASLSMSEIPTSTMNDIIFSNRYLLLPRLSSQDMFDQLCPVESSNTKRKLCVILITHSNLAHEPYRKTLRNFLKSNPLYPNRVRFTYIFQDKQSGFVEALTSDAVVDPVLRLVVLWRRDEQRVQYEWLEDGWAVEDGHVNVSEDRLRAAISTLLHSQSTLSHGAIVKSLVDEYALTVFSRLVLKLVTLTEYIKENVSTYDALPIVSAILSIGFIIGIGYFLSYLVKLEEQSITEKYKKLGKENPMFEKQNTYDMMVNKEPLVAIHELRGESYNGLVRLLRPGCRTIVLLVNAELKPKLFPLFQKFIHPYRRNRSLLFAFLFLEKNVDWYRRILVQTLSEPRELNINPKNCVGTVLSLNGHRRYFCMYHAKYQGMGKGTSQQNRKNHVGGGNFMGFEDSSESSESETSDLEAGPKDTDKKPLLTSLENSNSKDHLLDGLPNWLDRLFEGSTQRYYIQYWPSMK